MASNLYYWANLYDQHKYQARCIDIETSGYNGYITVITIYTPQEGLIEPLQLVYGQNLTSQNLQSALQGCKLLITFNGKKHDIPRIQQHYPNTLPDVPVLDLYLFKLNMGAMADLKTLEHHFNIARPDGMDRRGIAVTLWQRYQKYGDQHALAQLLEYNKQDAINLFPLAENITKMLRANKSFSKKSVHDIIDDVVEKKKTRSWRVFE